MTEPTPRCRDGRCTRMNPGLCGSCSDRVAGWLADLPALVARVADADPVACCDAHNTPLPAGAVPCPSTGARVSGTSATPLPGGVDRLSWLGMGADVHDPADAACQTGATPIGPLLATWARDVADMLAITRPSVGRLVQGRLGPVARCSAADVPALVTFLTRWHESIVAETWAAEYAQEIHAQWRTARALAGDTERTMRIGQCITLLDDGTCDEPLYAQPSDTVIRCRSCGADWTRELWLILGAAMAAMEEMSG